MAKIDDDDHDDDDDDFDVFFNPKGTQTQSAPEGGAIKYDNNDDNADDADDDDDDDDDEVNRSQVLPSLGKFSHIYQKIFMFR